jgi:hypothetical protein
VIPGDLLRDRAVANLLEEDEGVEHVEQPLRGERALHQRPQLQPAAVDQRLAIYGTPGHEAVQPSGDGPDAGLETVGGDKGKVEAHEVGEIMDVGLELVPGGDDVAVGRAFQLQYDQRQPINVEDDIRASPPVLELFDRELLQRQPLVVLRMVDVDQAELAIADVAVFVAPGDVDAVAEEVVERAVVLDGCRVRGLEGAADRVGTVGRVDIRVEPRYRSLQAADEHAPVPRLTLRADEPLGREVLTVPGLVAQRRQPGQDLVLECFLRDVPRHVIPPR